MTKLKGVYVLIIEVEKTTFINVGALGNFEFKKGMYAYVGSAQNNLEQRVNRHLRKKKQKFWHVDYLLENEYTKVVKVYFKQAIRSEECIIAKEIAERNEPVDNFGCSDCNCRSHLFHLEEHQFLHKKMQVLNLKT